MTHDSSLKFCATFHSSDSEDTETVDSTSTDDESMLARPDPDHAPRVMVPESKESPAEIKKNQGNEAFKQDRFDDARRCSTVAHARFKAEVTLSCCA